MSRILSLLLLFLLTFSLRAQSIFSGSMPLDFPVNYQSLQASPEYSKTLLDVLKRGSMAPGKIPGYQVGVESVVNLYREQSMTGFEIRFENWRSSGMSEYRNFQLGEFLLPTQVEASIGLKLSDGKIISIIQTGRLDSRSSFSTRGRINLAPVNGISPQMIDVQIYYDPGRLAQLNWKIQAIDDYYVSTGLLQDLKYQLSQMPPPDPAQSDLLVAKLNDADLVLAQVNSRNHKEKLNLYAGDPANLIPLMEEVQFKIASRRNVLNQVFASLDSYYYRKGLEAKARKNDVEAQDFFRRSIALNPYFAPSAYELALLRMNAGDYLKAEEELRASWFGMNPDPQTAGGMLIAFKDIFQYYLNKAEALRTKGKAEDGLDLLNRADRLCHDVRGMICHDELYRAMDRSRQSMLNQYVEEGFSALQSGKMEGALGAYDRGSSLYVANRGLNNRGLDSLKSSIAIAEIASGMEQAESDLKAGKYQEAFAGLELAERKLSDNKLEQGEQFMRSSAMIAKPIAMQKVSNLKGSQNLEEDIRGIGEFLTRYHLEQDKDIETAMGEYRAELKKRLCLNMQEKLDDYSRQFDRETLSKNYIRAEDACNKAIALTEKYPDCQLNSSQIAGKREEILPASVYQKMMNQILEMQSRNQTEEIVKKYTEAEKYFYQFNLEDKGLKYKPLKQFAFDNFRSSGLMYLAKYFREKGELEQSLSIYQELLTRGESASKFSKALYELGLAYGSRDLKNGIKGKPGELARKIAGRDSSLRPFYEGYTEGFEKK